MMSGNSDNVFWIIMSDTNDITRLDVVSSINKVFNGQIIDQRGFPPFYGVMLDSDTFKSIFVPELIPSSSTVFAGTDKIIVSCGKSGT